MQQSTWTSLTQTHAEMISLHGSTLSAVASFPRTVTLADTRPLSIEPM